MKAIISIIILLMVITGVLFVSCDRDELEPPPDEPIPGNKAPHASAGYDQTTYLPKDSVILDGSGSSDSDGTISVYQWSKISGPESGLIVDPTSEQTVVRKLVEGTYQFELTVTDEKGSIGKDITSVYVINQSQPPNGCATYPSVYVLLSQIGNLSDARSPSVATAGSKIVYAGGANRIDENCTGSWCNTLPSSAVDIYDVNLHTWSIAQLSEPRQGIGAVSNGNKIFFAGGSNFELYFNNGIVYDNVDIYDVQTNTWTVAHLSQARSYITAASLGNKVVFAGGTQDGISGTRRVDIYDVSTNTWTTAELSAPRYFIDAVVDGNKIYFVGGEDWDHGYYNNIDIYDISSNSWTTSAVDAQYYAITDVMVGNTNYWIYYYWGSDKVEIKNMSTGVITEGCASYGGAFSRNEEIVFMNRYSAGFLTAVTIYNTVTGEWSVGLLNMNLPSSAAIISADNKLYGGGGGTANNGYTRNVYAINW